MDHNARMEVLLTSVVLLLALILEAVIANGAAKQYHMISFAQKDGSPKGAESSL